MSDRVGTKAIYSLDELRLEIKKIFDERKFKGDLLREVSLEFESKGLNDRNLQMLLNEQIDVIDLNDDELMAIAKVGYDNLGWKKLDVNRYFGERSIAQYESKLPPEKATSNILELKDFRKIDDFNYRGQMSYYEIYEALNNGTIFYDYQAQRSSKYKKIANKKVKTPNLNKKAVKEISEAVLNGTFEDSEIILNCEIIRGKQQKFKFISDYKEEGAKIFGDIIIETNYNTNDKDTTWVSVTDGFHRIQGIIMAIAKHYQSTGQMLSGSIGVKLVRADKERAKRIVHQTFKRSADKPEWLESLVSNDYSKFVDLVLKHSKRLSVGNTIEDAKVNGKLTSKALLIETTKEMNIAFNDLVEVNFKSKDIAEQFDLIYDVANKLEIDVTPNKAIGYYYLAYKVIKLGLNVIDTMELLENNEGFVSESKKITNIKKYVNVIDEVINNE